mgnify:CR=1 FL=1
MNPKKLTAAVELITPQMACEMLKKQRNVRVLKRKEVERYVRALKRGWKLNGETIKFDKDGYLIDGQHRLTACAESGIAFGVEPVADFIQGIESGANLSPGTPRYELRRWMEARRSKNLNPYLLRRMLYVALVRAWKMEKEGVLQIKGQSLWSKIQITDLPEID